APVEVFLGDGVALVVVQRQFWEDVAALSPQPQVRPDLDAQLFGLVEQPEELAVVIGRRSDAGKDRGGVRPEANGLAVALHPHRMILPAGNRAALQQVVWQAKA